MDAVVYNKLDSLYVLTKSIENLYNKLYELERASLKNSAEYNLNLQYLKIALEVEEEKYDNLPFKQQIYIMEYLLNDKKIFFSTVDSIIYSNFINKPLSRIFSTLLNNIFQNQIKISSHLAQAILENQIPNYLQESTLSPIDLPLLNVIIDHTLSTFLIYLQKTVNENKNNVIETELIKIKYNIAFLNKFMESELMLSNFNPEFLTKFNPNFSTNFSNNEVSFFHAIKADYGEYVFLKEINKILIIKDANYNIKYWEISAILNQTYMRACLLLLDLEHAFYLFSNYYDYIYNHNINDTKKSQELIEKSFKNYAYERGKKGIEFYNNFFGITKEKSNYSFKLK